MAGILSLSLVQDKEINLEVPQGVAFSFGVGFYEADGVAPRDISGKTFLAQIRDKSRAESGKLIHQFSLAPDADQNKYVVDVSAGEVVFYVSNELAAILKAGTIYYFEVKTINGNGDPEEKLVIKLKSVADYAFSTV